MSEDPNKSQAPELPKNLHYRLTNEEWIQAVRSLTPSQRDILYYLRTLDPFGDRALDIGVREIAKILGYNPGTVSRALKALDNEGYIELDLLRVRVRIKSRKSVVSEQQCCVETTVLFQDNTHDPETTPTIATQHPRSPRNTQPPEPAPGIASRSPHTIHTNQTNKTLSEAQQKREILEGDPDFRAWLHRKALQLPNPPQLIEQWVAKQAKLETNQRDYLKSEGSAKDKGVPQQQPDRFQIESSCIAANDQGDRPFILGKLQQLWQSGWHDLVEDLCSIYPGWGIIHTNGGIIEGTP